MSSPNNATRDRLNAISVALQIPLDRLFEKTASCELEEANECLRLWRLLKTAEGRGRALATLRKAVDDEAT